MPEMETVFVGDESEQEIEAQITARVCLDQRRRRPHEVSEDRGRHAVVEELVAIFVVRPGHFGNMTGEHGILLPSVEVVVAADQLAEFSMVWFGYIVEQ